MRIVYLKIILTIMASLPITAQINRGDIIKKLQKGEIEMTDIMKSRNFSTWLISNNKYGDKLKLEYVKKLFQVKEVSSEEKLYALLLLHWHLDIPSYYQGNFEIEPIDIKGIKIKSSFFTKDVEFIRARSSLNAFTKMEEDVTFELFSEMSPSYKANYCFIYIDKNPTNKNLETLMTNFCKAGVMYENDIGAISYLYLLAKNEYEYKDEDFSYFTTSDLVSDDVKATLLFWKKNKK